MKRMSSLAVYRLPSSIFLFFCLIVLYLLITSLVYASTPTLGTVSPSSGTTPPDTAKSFVCKYSDASGWAHLKEVNLLISGQPASPANNPYLYYDQNLNQLFLRNESNTAWLGGFAPGSANIIENSLIKLKCAQTTVSGSGTTMTVTFNVTFKAGYSGRRCDLYLAAKDDGGIFVSFASKGTYTINRAPRRHNSFFWLIDPQSTFFNYNGLSRPGWLGKPGQRLFIDQHINRENQLSLRLLQSEYQ